MPEREPHDPRDRHLSDRQLEELATELREARTRWHKTVEMVQVHEGRLARCEWGISTMQDTLIRVQQGAEHYPTKRDLEMVEETLTMQLTHLKETVDPLRRMLNWAIALIVGGFLAALISLVMRGSGG